MTNLPALQAEQLKPWFDREDMVHACVAQTQKDLHPYGIQLHYSGLASTAYAELFSQLQPQLDRLLQQQTGIREILYRVDVSEKALHDCMQPHELLSASLSRLILWRELQKVVTRFLLSSEDELPSDEERF